MKNASKLLMAALLSGLLASCAGRTMDSIPTLAELNAYEQVVRSRYQATYDELEKKRASGAISKADYAEEKHRLDSKVAESVNNAAWNKHYLAESERKSNGVPTPDQPVALNPGQVGGNTVGSVGSGGMGSFYMPSYQNYGAVTGMGGSAGMGSMRGASDQINKVQSTRNDAMSAGGTYLSAPPPGSVYD
ncbi:hypothetical protein [Prosthecobacter sp.]|uniref:hypothetical protein n=1 Tax=Prosthecobacter sp. TaxID=1965333 RepID=UPI00248831A7|nr:hypothetical protein [Prosthecobacter sp.]MDI1315484.1 hypothetical protein [Prosthecobacter sp.]